jgi:hypothetical protein
VVERPARSSRRVRRAAGRPCHGLQEDGSRRVPGAVQFGRTGRGRPCRPHENEHQLLRIPEG